MIAKGNRSRQVTEACSRHGGFYLGSIGGSAVILGEENIRKVECIDYPAFILVDDKGHDFFEQPRC